MFSKTRTWQRFACLILTLGLIFTMVPASVFADETLTAGTTASVSAPSEEEPAVEGEKEPAAEGEKEPAAEEEPVVEGEKEPAAEGEKEPTAEGEKESAVEGEKEPVVESEKEPAVEEEPAAENEKEPAVEEEKLAVFTTVNSAMTSRAFVPDSTFTIVQSEVGNVYAVQQSNAWNAQWVDGGQPVSKVENPLYSLNDIVYFFISVPENMEAQVSFVETGLGVSTSRQGDLYELTSNSDVPFAKEAINKGCTHYFLFTGKLLLHKQNFDITIRLSSSKGYFYLRRPETIGSGTNETTDYYYVGEGIVNLLEPTTADKETVIENPSNLIKENPNFGTIILDGSNADLTSYPYDANNAEGTYSVKSWDLIKGESGATTAYPNDESLLPKKNKNDPTWHVDGTVQLNMPNAYFYLRNPDADKDSTDPKDYYYMGVGKVALVSPQADTEVTVTDENKDRLLTEPNTDAPNFPNITYNGVTYSYDRAGTGAAGTYSVKNWYVVKSANGAVDADYNEIATGLTWHVDGEITFYPPIDIPKNVVLPKVSENVTTVYDGEAHSLTIEYDKSYPAGVFKTEYQVNGGEWKTLSTKPDEDGKYRIPDLVNADRYIINLRFTYQYPNDPNVYKPHEENGKEVWIQQREIYVKVDDKSKTLSGAMPEFTYTYLDKTAEYPDSGLLPGHEITNKSDTVIYTWDGQNTVGKHEVTLLITEILDTVTGDPVTTNYMLVPTVGNLTISADPTPTPNPNPNPTPNPTPVPTPVPETPVVPAAPVTPVDDGDDAVAGEGDGEDAEAEDIEDEETPQASPEATPAPEATAEPEEIEDDATAQAGVGGSWALINLILMVLTVLAGLVMLGLRFAGKSGALHLIGVVPALVSLVAFFVTEDMSLSMVMTDRWTLIMALIALVQIVLMVLGRHGQDSKDNANA